MKVTFYSNFLTHHQVPFCLEMQKRLGDDFKFVGNNKISGIVNINQIDSIEAVVDFEVLVKLLLIVISLASYFAT